LLDRRGARLDALDGVRALPYHTVAGLAGAAQSGALDVVAGAAGSRGPNVKDGRGRTPLHYAAVGGVVENIQWLIGRGADSAVTDNNGILPLSLGLQSGQDHIVTAFGAGRSPPLKAAVLLGSVELLKRMVLNQSTPVDQVDPITGRSAIFEACETGRNDLITFMISQGADINSIDRFGTSVLAATVRAGQPNTIRLLLNHSVDVGKVLRNGSTALHVAAAQGALPEASVLLEAGASLEAKDYYGQTPMHLVSTAAMAELLLQFGARPLPTNAGLQPLHSAALAGRTQVMETMLKWRHGGVDDPALNGDTPLHLAAASGSQSAVALLLRWCADSQARNNASRLPHQLSFNASVSKAIRDSTMRADRCHCDCGPYSPGALYHATSWKGGCTATVRCQLDSYAGSSEEVRCAPRPGDGASLTSDWTPPRPTLACGAAVVSAASQEMVGQARVLVVILMFAPALWSL